MSIVSSRGEISGAVWRRGARPARRDEEEYPSVLRRGATQPGGMDRRQNAPLISPRRLSIPRRGRIFAALGACLCLGQAAAATPDGVSAPRRVGAGHSSDLAIDSRRKLLHLVYIEDASLLHRTGPVEGAFGPPEVIVTGSHWVYPRITLDRNGAPHVVVGQVPLGEKQLGNARRNLYTNRIGGRWKPPLIVFDRDLAKVSWVNFPTLAVDDDMTVFLGTKTFAPMLSKIARVENVATQPKVGLAGDVDLGQLNLIAKGARLLAVGGHKGEWHVRDIDKKTLKAKSPGPEFAGGDRSEQARSYLDARGEVHIAFAPHSRPAPESGFYTTLSRIEKKLPPIRYATTNTHHSGNGRVVRDERHPDRVYVFHWSGATGDKHGVYHQACVPDNRLHFVRIDHGRKVAELQPIEAEGSHGASFRNQASAVPHPDGGAIVLFTRCGPDGSRTLWSTSVGRT